MNGQDTARGFADSMKFNDGRRDGTMSWTELLNREIESAYRATEGLVALVEEDDLNWKPATGNNWMTTGQLLMHITNACGACIKGFVTGDWGLPEGMDISDMKPEDMLPPAEKMPTVSSVQAAKDALAEDKQVAYDMVEKAGEQALGNDMASAPWDPREMLLGHRALEMVGHLNNHKCQLFCYLKLQGKPVNTGHMYGMAPPA